MEILCCRVLTSNLRPSARPATSSSNGVSALNKVCVQIRISNFMKALNSSVKSLATMHAGRNTAPRQTAYGEESSAIHEKSLRLKEKSSILQQERLRPQIWVKHTFNFLVQNQSLKIKVM